MKRHWRPVRAEQSGEFARDEFASKAKALRQEILDVINSSRARRDLPPLDEVPRLTGDLKTDYPTVWEYMQQQSPEER